VYHTALLQLHRARGNGPMIAADGISLFSMVANDDNECQTTRPEHYGSTEISNPTGT